MRSVADMLAGIDAPLAPGCISRGRRLTELSSHQCRFALRGDGAATRFCAVEIAPDEWLPGRSGGSYCRFHRHISRASGADLEAA